MASQNEQPPYAGAGNQASTNVPDAPQVPPRPDWAGERDAGHLWNAVSGLSKETGELKAAVQQNIVVIGEFRADVKDFSKDIVDLQAQVREQRSFLKGVAWAVSAVFIVVSALLTLAWTSVIQPGLAHAIGEQIKPEIAKQLSEALPKQPQVRGRP